MISNFESGRLFPGAELRDRLVRALGMPESVVFGDKEE
jgi:hypothetical protein